MIIVPQDSPDLFFPIFDPLFKISFLSNVEISLHFAGFFFFFFSFPFSQCRTVWMGSMGSRTKRIASKPAGWCGCRLIPAS
jgi:hypothetical protein